MKNARPQRSVSISLNGRFTEDTSVSYSYWSPHDGISRTALHVCDLYQEKGTNTLFVLDYLSTLNGWVITGIELNPNYAPPPEPLQSETGPCGGSILTKFPDGDGKWTYYFYIKYYNTLSEAHVRFDPQETNSPP